MITIRPMQASDRDAVISIHRQSIYGLCKDYYTNEEMRAWTESFTPGLFDAGIRDPGNVGVVAVDSDMIVGFGFINEDARELRGLYVLPGHERQSAGQFMVAGLEAAARERDLSQLSLHSTKNAVAFYEKMGYAVIGPVRHPVTDAVALACVLMEKGLTVRRSED